MTEPPVRSCSASMVLSSSSRSSIRSSPSRTANGSCPTWCLACRTACPSPLGCPCRTKCTCPSSLDSRTLASRSVSPFASRAASSSGAASKWSASERLERPVMSRTSSRPARTASSTTYWIAGLSTIGSISLGVAFVAGRNLVPRPAAGMTALWMVMTGTVAGASGDRAVACVTTGCSPSVAGSRGRSRCATLVP